MLIVPPGSYGGIHPVNTPLRENKLEIEKINAERERLDRETNGPQAPIKEVKKQLPRIRIEPVVAPQLAIKDKPRVVAKKPDLLTQAIKNYVPNKTMAQIQQEAAERKRLKEAEAKRAKEQKEKEREEAAKKKKAEAKRIVEYGKEQERIARAKAKARNKK